MHGLVVRRVDPELKQIVREASRALAALDVERLEELSRACEALNHVPLHGAVRAERARQATAAAADMAVFARVLEATRANLNVMNRLRALRQGQVEYGEPTRWTQAEVIHGNH
ncbi:MAG TPA: hypothetical protein VG225_00665 [Terracidiphilus sp.]|nr:hypothetical protein [Terracidiphilus sp.]